MFEIIAALLISVFVIVFWRDLWTLGIGIALVLFTFIIGGGFTLAAFYNDTVIALALALVPALLFMIYRMYQIRKMEHMHLQQRIMRTRISTQYEKGSAIGIEGESAVIIVDEDTVFPTDRRGSSAYSDSIAASAAAFVYDREHIKSILRSEVEQIILQGQDNTSGAGVSIDPEGTKRRGRV